MKALLLCALSLQERSQPYAWGIHSTFVIPAEAGIQTITVFPSVFTGIRRPASL